MDRGSWSLAWTGGPDSQSAIRNPQSQPARLAGRVELGRKRRRTAAGQSTDDPALEAEDPGDPLGEPGDHPHGPAKGTLHRGDVGTKGNGQGAHAPGWESTGHKQGNPSPCTVANAFRQ